MEIVQSVIDLIAERYLATKNLSIRASLPGWEQTVPQRFASKGLPVSEIGLRAGGIRNPVWKGVVQQEVVL